MKDQKLNEAYYQPDHFWTGSKEIKELHKITSISKKEALWQVYIQPSKEINRSH